MEQTTLLEAWQQGDAAAGQSENPHRLAGADDAVADAWDDGSDASSDPTDEAAPDLYR